MTPTTRGTRSRRFTRLGIARISWQTWSRSCDPARLAGKRSPVGLSSSPSGDPKDTEVEECLASVQDRYAHRLGVDRVQG